MGAKPGSMNSCRTPPKLVAAVTDKVAEVAERRPGGGAARAKGRKATSGVFIRKCPGNISDVYNFDARMLGEGAFGSVFQGRHKTAGVVRAIKTVPKGNREANLALQQEIAIMQQMDHAHIVKLFETFEDRKCFHFAMELCEGGELFDRIASERRFSENQAAMVMRQMLQAAFYMHSNRLAHRDLKPENFLFLRKDGVQDNVLKLIDFGLAKHCEPGQMLKSKVGTPMYMAPQVLTRRYDTQCDMWSIGVIMYILLSGKPPFLADTEFETLDKVRLGQWKFAGACWGQVSDDAKSLVKTLLRMSPKLRATAEDALDHAWIRSLASRASRRSIDAEVVGRLRSFETHNRLKRAALGIVARDLDDSSIRPLRQAFEALDKNQDGKLTASELNEGIARTGLEACSEEIKRLVANVDADGSGAIDYTEFLAATLDRKSVLTEDVLRKAFAVFDQNGDGKISCQELHSVLSAAQDIPRGSSQSVAQIMQEVDSSGSGAIEFHEFAELMVRNSERGAPKRARSSARSAGGLGGA